MPVYQYSSVPPQQHSHTQTTQQLSSQPLYQQHQSQSMKTSNDVEKVETSPRAQLPQQEEKPILRAISKQKQPGEEPEKPELEEQHH
ncbi:hypothetical protein R1flu_023820 [Riccia fluitans]|uniref:Uncharacterized protein n=1 Tax=Riccia fluitans TaxID=41844 RepID=A0ABD1XT43_9MARC